MKTKSILIGNTNIGMLCAQEIDCLEDEKKFSFSETLSPFCDPEIEFDVGLEAVSLDLLNHYTIT